MILPEKNNLRVTLKEKRHHFVEGLSKTTLKKYAHAYIDFFLDALSPIPPLGIGGYWPIQDEADCRLLLQALFAQGFTCGLPCIQGPQKPLTYRHWTPMCDLKRCSTFPSNLDLREPFPESACLIPQIILIPTLGYDQDGYRLGYGGGFYDRTLKFLRTHSHTPIISVGVSLACLEVEDLPHEPHDEKLDWIMTEEGIHKFPSPWERH